jgi:peptidoglycan hydrolase-like protein with peptidoglycan-binding domain
MFKARNLATLLALSSVAVLPACSMFGGGNHQASSAAGNPSQSYASAQPAPMAPQVAPMSQDTIRQVQQALQQDGMYKARVDGVWGPATEAAVHSYQQQHDLTATGQLDSDTLASLNLGNNNQNYGSNATSPNSNQPANNQATDNQATDNTQQPNDNAQSHAMSQSNNANPPANTTR